MASSSNISRDWQERLGLIGTSGSFKEAIAQIPLVADSCATVLIQGESGTGKELFARAVHLLSGRGGPFVPLNCGAIPADLFERELFGHRRSAFTGAVTSEPGLVQAAEGGTLFLDEIDSIPLQAQSKLLRLLQEKEFRALGATTNSRADVRIVAATNTNLSSLTRAGTFRLDLYYRLSVLFLHAPPLRGRGEDIALIAEYFLVRQGQANPSRTKQLSTAARAALLAHDWPGNVRELQHVIERSAVMSGDRPMLHVRDLRLNEDAPAAPLESTFSFKEAKARAVALFERAYLAAVLDANDGNIARAARAAKKNRRAFWQLMRKHAIEATPSRARTSEPPPAALTGGMVPEWALASPRAVR